MAREDRHRRSAALQKPNPSLTLKDTERTHDTGTDHRDNRHIAYEVLWTCAWTCTVLYRSIRLVHQWLEPTFQYNHTDIAYSCHGLRFLDSS